ncbi:hypothetical protein COHA_006914 [Chlorella ohadii]|uniref:Uncharacterized protein n=1 Tax=Chlorella ohadii TaxID=2649997 RepID=A0AAD5DMY2_9CHLO|nr:hypothetical protein COHA_006914 [Chlorella ohadii]
MEGAGRERIGRMDLGLERHSSDADAKKPASQGGLGPRAGQPFCCAPGNCLKGVEKPGEFCADHTLRYHGAKAVGGRYEQLAGGRTVFATFSTFKHPNLKARQLEPEAFEYNSGASSLAAEDRNDYLAAEGNFAARLVTPPARHMEWVSDMGYTPAKPAIFRLSRLSLRTWPTAALR